MESRFQRFSKCNIINDNSPVFTLWWGLGLVIIATSAKENTFIIKFEDKGLIEVF